MKKIMCVLGFVLVFGGAEELIIHETNTESPANPLTKQLEKKESEEKQGAKVGKNLSIKADAFVNDGYSEMELDLKWCSLYPVLWLFTHAILL